MHKGSIVFGKFAMAGNDGIAILNMVTIIETAKISAKGDQKITTRTVPDPDSFTQ